MSELRVIKLVSGEEIIGQIDGEYSTDDDYINLHTIYNIKTRFDSKGAYAELSPFMVAAELKQLFTFDSRHVILSVEPTMTMVDYYFDFDEKIKKMNKDAQPPSDIVYN